MKKRKTMAKRLLSSVTSALLAVSSMLPAGFTPGEMLSAGAAANLGEKDDIADVVLLAGNAPKDPHGRAYSGLDTVDAVTAQYNKDYLLGVASMFSVFIQDDMTVNGADTEGRMALGGSFNCGWEYALAILTLALAIELLPPL